MRLIEGPTQLPYPPRACAVTNRVDGDFVDLQVVIDRPEPTRLYLKTDIVEQAGRLCGMVPASEVEALKEQLQAMGAELDDLRETMNLYAEFEEKLGKERTPAHA